MKCGRFIIIFFLIVLYNKATRAQVAIKATPDRYQILIGEPITVTLTGYFPLGVSINWNLPDSLPHFEYLDKGRADTVESIDGKKITQTIRITSFDSGKWEIPSIRIVAGNKSYYSDTVMIDIGYTPFNPEADYRDIKDIEEAKDETLKWVPWIIGAVSLICLIAAILLLRRKPKVVAADPPVVSRFSPYEEAMLAMAELRKKGWPQNGEVKAYYTRLNDILRQFVSKKLKIRTEDKTNEELIRELRQLNIPVTSMQQITDALRMSDFVKFAKYQPGSKENQDNYNIIETALKIVNNIS